MVTTIAWSLVILAVAVPLYAYLVYPALLATLRLVYRPHTLARPEASDDWPMVSISLPAYNEAATIRTTIEQLLATDYPPDRRQIVVVSDASTDGTDDIVREFAERGVELIRQPSRQGKTAAENAARDRLRGEIVVNTDASVRVHPGALRAMVAAFRDPAVGVASARDVSVQSSADIANAGESAYVGYEMWVRRLETQVGSIVGASGCLYAIRAGLHVTVVPSALSRDFAAALIAREQGFRAVSVDEAICFVGRSPSLRKEYARKVRTMTRGLETLYYKRRLLHPLRFGLFGWMLFSHKLARWLVPWAAVTGLAGLMLLAVPYPPARVALGIAALGILTSLVGWWLSAHRPPPRLLSLAAYAGAGIVAGLHAWLKALRGELNPVWEPTRRGSAGA